jgi:hypothetical protein
MGEGVYPFRRCGIILSSSTKTTQRTSALPRRRDGRCASCVPGGAAQSRAAPSECRMGLARQPGGAQGCRENAPAAKRRRVAEGNGNRDCAGTAPTPASTITAAQAREPRRPGGGSSRPTRLPRALRTLAHEAVVNRGRASPSGRGRANGATVCDGHPRWPCHKRAIHSGSGRYRADNHGQPRSDLDLRCSPPSQVAAAAELALGAGGRSVTFK